MFRINTLQTCRLAVTNNKASFINRRSGYYHNLAAEQRLRYHQRIPLPPRKLLAHDFSPAVLP
jgi:hypothetical protein